VLGALVSAAPSALNLRKSKCAQVSLAQL
jgi:hypothetical protein